MDEADRINCIDFLDIAVEEMEHGNYETAQEFVEDVYAILQEEDGAE